MERTDPPESTDERREISHDIIIKSMIVFTYICLGAYRYVPGITLIEMSVRLNQSLEMIYLLYTCRATGYIVGYTAGPFILANILHSANQFLLICISTFLLATVCFAVTFIRDFHLATIVFAASGVCFAVVDISVAALLKPPVIKRNRIFIYILHFFYAIGSVSFTMVSRDHIQRGLNATSVQALHDNYKNRMQNWIVSDISTSIEQVYLILSSLIFILSVLWLASHCFRVFHTSFTSIAVEENQEVIHRRYKYADGLNFSLLNFVGGSLDFSYSQVLPLHCFMHREIAQEVAVYQVVKFLGFFCFGRLTEILIYRKVKPNSMLFLGSVLAIISSFLFYLGNDKYELYFFLGNALLGFGSATYFPSLFSWGRTKIPGMHHTFMPYMVMTSLAEMVLPLIAVKVISASILHYYVLVASSAYFLLLLIQHLLFHRPGTKSKPLNKEFPESLLNFISKIHKSKAENNEPKAVKCEQVEKKEEFSPSQTLQALSDMKFRVNEKNREIENVFKDLEFTTKSLSLDDQVEKPSASKIENKYINDRPLTEKLEN